MTTLDRIVRSVLIKKGLSMHWYLQFLKYGADCIRELSYSTIPFINAVEIKLNNYAAIDLPCDFQDIVRVGAPFDQFVHPITQRNSATRLLNHNQYGEPIPWSLGANSNTMSTFAWYPGYWMYNNIDDLGESLGRAYGLNTGLNNVWYKLIKERRQIQFSEKLPYDCIVLEYIGDGECADNVTQVDSYAISTIEAYIDWMYKTHQRRMNLGEVETARQYYKTEFRYLRARVSELDIYQIRQILQRAYNGSPKSS